MKVLITGGAGFIGSNLANQLNKQGHEVMVIDNLFLGDIKNLEDGVKFINADVRQVELYAVFDEFKPTHVVHLAALSSAPMFGDGKADNPVEWTNVNVKGFQKILDHSKRVGAKFLYASTSSLYGNVEEQPPYPEELKVNPRTFYEATLYTREILAKAYYHSLGYPSVGFRFFSVYGPNETHKGKYANNITQFLWDMQKNKIPVVYGDGTQTRDFTHVNDVVTAIQLAMKQKNLHGVFNIGTGFDITFNQVIDLLNEELGTKIHQKFIKNPINNYVQRTLADTGLAEQALKFKAKIPVEKGIKMQVREYS